MRTILDQFIIVIKGKQMKYVLQKRGGQDFAVRVERGNAIRKGVSIHSFYDREPEALKSFEQLRQRFQSKGVEFI